MEPDPIIAEIRRIRLEIEAECQNDSQLLYEYICRVQEKYRDRLVRRSPKLALVPPTTIKIIDSLEEINQY